jgi:hypothetical protein
VTPTEHHWVTLAKRQRYLRNAASGVYSDARWAIVAKDDQAGRYEANCQNTKAYEVFHL